MRGMKTLLGAIALVAGIAQVQAQDLPRIDFKVVGTSSTLPSWARTEKRFWEGLPKASGGRFSATAQSITERGLKGPAVMRLLKLGQLDFAHVLSSDVAEDAWIAAAGIAGSGARPGHGAQDHHGLGAAPRRADGQGRQHQDPELVRLADADDLLQGTDRIARRAQGQEGAGAGRVAGRPDRRARRHPGLHALRRGRIGAAAWHGRLRRRRRPGSLPGALARGGDAYDRDAGGVSRHLHRRQHDDVAWAQRQSRATC